MPLRSTLHRKPSSARWPNRSTKRREVPSVNMISLPLADFRHITHIGNGADSFGDLSFLKTGRGLLLQSSQSEQDIFLACSPPPPPKPPRLMAEGPEGPEGPGCRSRRPAPDASQRRGKCSSLPLLDSEDGEEEAGEGGGRRSGSRVSGAPPSGLGRGSLNSDKDEDSGESGDKTVGQRREEDAGGFSFSLDLGPSILDDVLQVMDKRQ